MVDWPLAFKESQPLTIETYARALSALATSPVATDVGSLGGNPRDGYDRSVTITARRGDVRIQLAVIQTLRGPDDPDPVTALCGCTLHAPGAPFATKLATWMALRDALAQIGCTDRTLAWRPAPIVDEAEAAGETAAAARLRSDITAALVAEAPSCRHICLMSTRADIEAVLAAYVETQDIFNVVFEDCSLSALPTRFAGRFPNVESLSWVDDGIDGRALRGISLARLTRLHVRGSGLRHLSREDLAGFPMLADLCLENTPLEDLDPDIIEVCPGLRRVVIIETPLARDAAKIAVLRARCQAVHWQLTTY